MASPLDPIRDQDWDSRKARHLLNRAGFGLPREWVEKLTDFGVEGSLRYLVDFDAMPDTHAEPDFLASPDQITAQRMKLRALNDEERRRQIGELRQMERLNIQRLKIWWLDRMYTTRRPLQEKMTLFWHGHFATSAQKVKYSHENYQINQLFREHAAGNVKALTTAVGQSPAMLDYLDNDRSTKEHPNENWAREFLELFTIGKDHYTENDIKEGARAFTGWRVRDFEWDYDEEIHDFGEKTFMGQTGNFDGWDIIDIVFEQPQTAEHIARKLWTFFAYERPEPEIVFGLANNLRSSNYELKPVLREMFGSNAFYSEKAVGTQVKSPATVVLQVIADLDLTPPPLGEAVRSMRDLGQDLLYPPNVKGWDGNQAWINANSLLLRYNLPVDLVRASQTTYRRAEEYRREHGDDALLKMGESMDSMSMTQQAAMGHDMADLLEAMQSRPGEVTPWNSKAFFRTLEFTTAGECIDRLIAHFLDAPLREEQKQELVAALGAGNDTRTPLTAAQLNEKNMNAVLHLLLSMAEYQLC